MARFTGILSLAALILTSCSPKGGGDDTAGSAPRLPDTLRVVTLYSPTSFFIYRDTEMGYDYSLVKNLTKEKGMHLQLEVAPSLGEAIARLDSGLVDLVAYEVPVTSEYLQRVVHCGPVNTTHQVLVQPKKSDTRVTDVTQLVGRDIYVESDSKYQQRINNLNEELGGGINIHTVNRDTLITEDLIEMVEKGEIPMTVVDSDIARLNKTYYRDLDITLEVSFPQKSAWAVSRNNSWLADSIDAWLGTEQPGKENAMLLKRYFELSKGMPTIYTVDLKHGHVSPFDDIFRRHASTAGVDWRILAAQGFTESRFNNDVVSWAGARGMMQIMPRTARAYDVEPTALVDPDVSVGVAAKIMETLNKSLASKVPDPKERQYFVLAAYNSGLGHIYDAIALAAKTGRDPQKWFGNVEEALLLKSNPEYYNDPVCRNGYFRGRQTAQYVHEVLEFYDRIVANNIK